MSELIPWLFLAPPLLVTLLALASYAWSRSPRGQAVRLLRQGGVHLYQEQWEQAEEAFQAGLKLQPEHPGLLGSLASLLVSRQRYEEAEPILTRALAATPSDARLQVMEGRRRLGMGLAAQAMEIWATIPEDSDVYVDAQSLMAQQHEAQGQPREAVACLERAISKGTVHQVRPHKKELRRLQQALGEG